MKKLDKILVKFITKYPFVTDPIVLFSPSLIPEDKKILKGKLKLNYPRIQKLQKKIEKIKKDFYNLIEYLHKSKFSNIYLKDEYSERIKDFYKVIRLIEVFYEEEEYEKFNLINDYFGIDFILINEILDNKDFIVSQFDYVNPILSESKITELEDTYVNAIEIKQYFDEALEFMGYEKNRKVKVGKSVSVVHTNFNKKGGDIIIPRKKYISVKQLLLLIIHEIDGHCVQFTNCDTLSSGGVRYSRSESLAEGFAVYNEYKLAGKFFGENRAISLYEINKQRYDFLEGKLDFDNFVRNYSGYLFRNFRAFTDIKKYINCKDFVYFQGLYKVIKYSKEYNNFFEMIENGAVNSSYIEKHGDPSGRKETIKIENTSAYYILERYFL